MSVETPTIDETPTTQLRGKQVPEWIEHLVAGRAGIRFVKVHDVGEPAAGDPWLREHATLVREVQLVNAWVIEFTPNTVPRV